MGTLVEDCLKDSVVEFSPHWFRMASNTLLHQFIRRHPLLMLLASVLGMAGALFNGIGTALVAPVILAFLGQEVNLSGGPPLLKKFFAYFDGFPATQRLGLMIGIILLAIVFKNATTYASSLTSSYLARSLVGEIRSQGVKLLMEVDLSFHSQSKIGDLTNHLGNEMASTAIAIQVGIQLLTSAATILVFTGLLVSISWQLTLASSALLGIVFLANNFFVKRGKRFGKNLADQARHYSNGLIETLSGIRLVKGTGTEQAEYLKLKRLIDAREEADFQAHANISLISPVNEVAGVLTVLGIVILGRLFFASQLGALSSILLTYLLILFRLLPCITQLNHARGVFANATPSIALASHFLERENKPFMPLGNKPFRSLQNEIRFEHLYFRYPHHTDFVLQDVNLTLPRGTTLALVGASGAGKSTLVDLLPRFYDPTDGRITLDGVDLREFDLLSLRRAMGIVSQDTFLFNTSVGANIAYGCPNASQDQIIDAAKRANAYEFIVKLPQGFETIVGDRGVMLSGGQRQRLAIARALLRDPDILILDEATSALDTASERLVQQAIEELSRDRTVLVIAHRLSTVQQADQIAVLDQGQLVEVGTHTELLKQKGYYAKLHQIQFCQEDLGSSGIAVALTRYRMFR